MIKKRFDKIRVYLSYEIIDNINKKQLDVDETVDLLNQLNEENEQLKKENQRLNQTLKHIQKELNRHNNEWVDL